MAVGLIDENGNSISVLSVYCDAEVTEDFGVFTVRHKFCNNGDSVADASFLFPVSNCEIIVDFKVYAGKEAIISHLVPKRAKDGFEGYSLSDTSADKCCFKVHIGKMAPGRTIETELKYIKSVESNGRYCKIVIPTVVMPNFKLNENQFSFDVQNTMPDYALSLDFAYHGYGIKNAVCKTHSLKFDKGKNTVTAAIADNSSSNYDIVIEVEKDEPSLPAVYKYNNIIYLGVRPDISVYDRQGKRYLFMINVTDRHKDEIKNALHLCLKALGGDDMFNIIMLSRQNSVFSDGFEPADDKTVKAAMHWFDSYELGDSVELFSTSIASYKSNSSTVTVVFTDVKMSQNNAILKYIDNHKNTTYYTFDIDGTDDASFLKAIAAQSGGKYYAVSGSERAEIKIAEAFNTIAAPFVSNTAVSFDDAVSGVALMSAKKIHCGDSMGIIAEIYDRMPGAVYIDGVFSGKKISVRTPLENIVQGGASLRYLYAKSTIENLADTDESISISEQKEINRKIIEISEKYGIYNSYMDMLLMNYNGKFYDCVSIVRPKALPYDWYMDALRANSARPALSNSDGEFIKIIKKQKAVGAFVPVYSKSKESVAKFTGEVLSKICLEYHNPSLFMWQLRKSVLFLMDYIADGSAADIPPEILKGLNDWYNTLGGTDEISQKVNAISYMYGKN